MSVLRYKNPETGEWEDIKTISGKSAYEYAKDGGFTGTEEEFASKLTEELPTALPNPNALTINGQTYDGSAAVEVDNRTDEVPDYVRAEAERVAALAHSRQNANTVSFLLGSDIHARLGLSTETQMLASTKHAAQAMQIIREQVHLDIAGLLGDFLWDGGETADQAMEMYRMIAGYFAPAFNGVPQVWCKGNHDMLPSNDVELTDTQVFTGIGIHNTGAAFDGDNRVLGYCHRDFDDRKLRIVCMNTSETSNSHAVGNAQINWLKTVLAVEEGWKVVILSHIPLDWWGTSATVYSTVAAFADNILCNIHGHTHNYITGTVGDTAIPRIAIPNMDFYRANTYADNETFGEDQAYPKTADSAEDTAFCVITIDLAANKLYADHYGAGYDRKVDLNTGAASGGDDSDSSGAYTNQIPLSTDSDGTAYNGGVGYKTGTRINSSYEEASASNMCCTGFIPVRAGDVIRIKNVTMAGGSTPYGILYDASYAGKQTYAQSAMESATVNGVTTLTVTDGTDTIRFFRLSVGVINDTSIITVNEEI